MGTLEARETSKNFFLDVRMEEEKLKRDRRIKKSLLVNTRVLTLVQDVMALTIHSFTMKKHYICQSAVSTFVKL